MMIAAPKQFLLFAAVVLSASAVSGCTSANDDGATPSPQPAAQSAGEGETAGIAANDLREGNCMTDSGTASDPIIRVMPCSEPHAFEVFATTELAAGEYPGIGEADAEAQDFCRSEFVTFVGVGYDASTLVLQYFYPVEADWADEGGRSVICLVGDEGGAPSVGTLRDSER